MKTNELFSWFQKNYPQIMTQWANCSHNYSCNDINPYHQEGLLSNHMMMVMNMAEQFNVSLKGNISCLFHDLGKPITRRENHEKKRVSMLNHEAVSAFMSVELMENLSKDVSLTTKDKIDIFFAICYHIDFHKILATAHREDNYQGFVDKFKGMPTMAKTLVELGVCDSLGRFSDPEISPKETILWSLIEKMEEMNIYEQMKKEKVKVDQPVVEFLIGLPCSGKSSYRNNKSDYKVICRDDIILSLGEGKAYEEAYRTVPEGKVNEELDKAMKLAVKNKEHFIMDQTNLVKSSRLKKMNQMKGYYKRAVLFIEELPVIYERNRVRSEVENKFISDEVFYRMMTSFYPPSFEEGFDEIVIIYKGEQITFD